jgi:uroporphyrinogen decarboxylase
MQVDECILCELGIDTRAVPGNLEVYPLDWIDENTYIDNRGVKFHMPDNGLYYSIIDHPLSRYNTIDEIEGNYIWPDFDTPEAVAGLKARAKKLYDENEYAIVGDLLDGAIFESSWNLRGMENLMTDLLVNKEVAHHILRKVTDYQKKRMCDYLGEVGAYLDIVFVGDDLAGAQSTLMSPDTYREMVKPYHAEYFSYIKSLTAAKLLYHSCGAIASFLDDLIEIGVDILNPIQTKAAGMDAKGLKGRFGDRIVFWGAVDSYDVMPHGNDEEVKREVEYLIETLGPTGYVLCENHNIQSDIPPANVITMYRHAKTIAL